MNWAELIGLVEPYAPAGTAGGPPFVISVMLRIHFLQQWSGPSHPAVQEALHDVPLYRQFVGLNTGATRTPDRSQNIPRYRHILEEHQLSLQLLVTIDVTLAMNDLLLKTGTVVDATLIAALSSTKNSNG